MHDHIISGYDGSRGSAAAASWAADEALRRGSGLTVLGCYMEPKMTDFGLSSLFPSPVNAITLGESTQAHVDELAADLAESHPGLAVNACVAHGRAPQQLVEHAEQSDLLVIGATGSGGSATSFMGSVVRSVIRNSPCPVVVVPGGNTMPDIPRVVLGVEGGVRSAAALEWAIDESDLMRGELEIVHAYSYPYADGGHTPSEARDLLRIDAANELERAVERARTRGGSKVDGHLIEGRPASAIIERARGADLVVIGIHREPTSLYLAVLGSVAETVVSHPPCPVAVVRDAQIASRS